MGDATLTAGSSVNIAPQTTGQAATITVGSFTDANGTATASDFVAAGTFAGTTIDWGDGTTPSTASVAKSGTTFTVSGSHAYATHGTTAGPVVVHVLDVGGSTATITDNKVLVADSVMDCTGTGTCNAGLQSGGLSASITTSNSNSGYLLINGDQNNGQLNCGDGFKHAPTVISTTNTFSTPSGDAHSTETFPDNAGIVLKQGAPGDPTAYAVCFDAAPFAFTDITGNTVSTGLLRMCNPFIDDPGPCYNSISTDVSTGMVTENITYPAEWDFVQDTKHM